MHQFKGFHLNSAVVALAGQVSKSITENSAWKPFTVPAPELPEVFKHRFKKLNRLRSAKADSLARARDDYKYHY